MPFTNPRVVATSPNPNDWPKQDLPEFLLAGKSNVGKSSLINALCQTKKLAYVGQTPGKTRMLNFYEVNEGIRLVDAPGYGYQKVDPKRNYDFEKLMNDYFSKRNVCKGILLLIDARREVDELDYLMNEFAIANDIPLIVILTKIDKLNTTGKKTRPNYIADKLGLSASKVIVTSSTKKDGIDNLKDRLLAMAKSG